MGKKVIGSNAMVGPDELGRVSGASQSMASLALILGPLFGGIAYMQWGHFEAYGSSALITVLTIVSVLVAVPALRRHQAEMEADRVKTSVDSQDPTMIKRSLPFQRTASRNKS